MRSGHVQPGLGGLAILLGCLLALGVSSATAQAPFEVGPVLSGTRLGKHFAVFQDPTGELGIRDVEGPAIQRLFEPVRDDAPSFGLNKNALWLRMQVQNPEQAVQPWLLEIAYPHLDSIELYIPDGTSDGQTVYRLRKTGDSRVFAERDVQYRNFVFKLEEPARSTPRTYYVRIQTGGSLSVPLLAWTYDAFLQHQNTDLPLLWMFYGVILVMAVYNLFIYFAVRRVEYLYYVLYNFTLAVLEFVLAGLAFEHLCPNNPWLANHLMPCTMALLFLWTSLFFRRYLSLEQTLPAFDRYYLITAWISVGLAVYALLVPPSQSLSVVIVVALAHTTVSMGAALVLVGRNYRPAKFYSVAWLALLCGIFCYLLKSVGVLPTSFVTEWGVQVGAALEVVLLSFALADRITIMRENLSELNAQLSHNVTELLGALTRAEEATRAKSEFLATMSHELRTPLNAIINIPQGLLSDFVRADAVLCRACDSVFEPEAGDDPVTSGSRCPHCQGLGSLREERITRYVGSPEQTVHHLAMVERSGMHLLQMVNGVLDFSKIDASALKLRLETFEVGCVLTESIDATSELATRTGVALTLELEPTLRRAPLVADALRVKQVLINLIGNAVKFSEGRGQVCVTVGVHQTERDFRFFVRDQGIGIAPEHQARIFERFEQVDQGDTRKYGGTGLGLSISRSLVELHGGHIWVESQLGRGATFYVRLPSGATLPRAEAAE
ncbi:MAG: putative two-component sensor [Myxococcaceae bacterium]|nr:putative two-component sensor [Myxococcaceae bacterium]